LAADDEIARQAENEAPGLAFRSVPN